MSSPARKFAPFARCSRAHSFSLREFLILMKKIIFTASYGDTNAAAVANAREKAKEIEKRQTTRVRFHRASSQSSSVLMAFRSESKTRRESRDLADDIEESKVDADADADADAQAERQQGQADKDEGVREASFKRFGKRHIFESDDALKVACAIRMQAVFRGRIVRKMQQKMSREAADLLWYSTIKQIVIQVFEDIAGEDKSLDIEEFVRWINDEWRKQRRKQRGEPEDALGSDEDSFLAKPPENAVALLPSATGQVDTDAKTSGTEVISAPLSSAALKCAIGAPPPVAKVVYKPAVYTQEELDAFRARLEMADEISAAEVKARRQAALEAAALDFPNANTDWLESCYDTSFSNSISFMSRQGKPIPHETLRLILPPPVYRARRATSASPSLRTLASRARPSSAGAASPPALSLSPASQRASAGQSGPTASLAARVPMVLSAPQLHRGASKAATHFQTANTAAPQQRRPPPRSELHGHSPSVATRPQRLLVKFNHDVDAVRREVAELSSSLSPHLRSALPFNPDDIDTDPLAMTYFSTIVMPPARFHTPVALMRRDRDPRRTPKRAFGR